MRHRMRIAGICCAFIAAGCVVLAQGSQEKWVGVWEGTLNGQPGAILTLAEDNGTLEGTLVLNIISRDGGDAHIIAHEPHSLMHSKLEGDTLSFDVKRIDKSGALMNFAVTIKGAASATIHCTNCDDAPVVQLTKQR